MEAHITYYGWNGSGRVEHAVLSTLLVSMLVWFRPVITGIFILNEEHCIDLFGDKILYGSLNTIG
jgi:hypothetical protein